MSIGRRRAAALAAPMALMTVLLTAPAHAADCRPPPLGKRELFLRGTMNHWGAPDEQKFRARCDGRYELVTKLAGEHAFKIADEDWSPDADLGGPPEAMRRKGAEIKRRFAPATYRLVLTMATPDPGPAPRLEIETCPAAPPGSTTLYLRGTMNNWAALDDYAFQYHCDAYYLNVSFATRQEFKIADAAWSDATTFGARADGSIARAAEPGGAGNIVRAFDGEHTMRLAFDAAGAPQLSVGPRTFADPNARAVTDPLALSLRFDSRAAAHKAPFGAVPEGTTVEFRLGSSDAPAGARATLVIEKRRLEGNQEVLEYAPVARVPMQRTSDGKSGGWSAAHRFDAKAIYGYYFELETGGATFVYQNNQDAIYWTREKGSMGAGSVDEMPADPRKIRRYRQTVHAADFTVPAWARDAVYYYIFPERFRNGDKANDPRPGRDRYHDKTVEFHARWTEKPAKPGTGDGYDDVYNNDFFGGDLAGIIEKLDDIKALGANAIYMTPVFRAASNHKYDTADYRSIDPAFGTNADFERLCAEAAKRGIRVIPDTSLNHVGSDSPYFNRFSNFAAGGAFDGGRINAGSAYADWFTFDATQTETDKQYKGWVGVTDLPELNKNSASFRRFAYGPDGVMQLWLDRGAAGWRMDVAPWVPDDFWREWRAAIKAHRPDAITIAETWFDASKFFLGDAFDSTMNYIFRNAVLDYAGGGRADKLYANFELMREAYPPQALFALMNLLSTHDQARALHHFGYIEPLGRRDAAPVPRGEPESLGRPGAFHDDGDAEALASAKRRLVLAVFFQMTYPGAPAIYYGDEVGVAGGDDPYNRATYPWPDEGGKPDLALRAEFRRLIQLRRDHAVLRHGSLDAPIHADAHAIVLLRRLGKQVAITATNNATATHTVPLKLPAEMAGAVLVDALSGEKLHVAKSGELALPLPPLHGRVLLWN